MVQGRTPRGINGETLGAWIVEHYGDGAWTAADLSYRVLSVGRSNLTFHVLVGDEPRWVLRRPPTGNFGGGAHDVMREGRIMQALGPTEVPTVTVLDLVDDPAVLDAPFVFMDYCPGSSMNEPGDLESIPQSRRHEAGLKMVDVLAAIHRVDLDTVGLGDLRRPGSLVERQLRRWLGQFQATTPRSIPAVQRVHDLLVAQRPAESRTGLTHGDFKPNNMIWAPDGTIRAVVDWELSAVGETMADLGYFIAMMTASSRLTNTWVPRPADGFPSAEELIARYEEQTAAPAADVRFFQAFALWKFACIREGVYSRLLKGQMGDLDVDPEIAGEGVEELVIEAEALLTTP